ncbi:hypothetical protein EYF80_061773 [Liparis tanakae]|uniref:Uncharacterized protein n=1 Tax=Liparis tanakae TaxID=230148 RepID=A0A4Z2EGS0_9TELE|nr:hypothetical protein EYF80_061773 [Liparis tanakae]
MGRRERVQQQLAHAAVQQLIHNAVSPRAGQSEKPRSLGCSPPAGAPSAAGREEGEEEEEEPLLHPLKAGGLLLDPCQKNISPEETQRGCAWGSAPHGKGAAH